MNTSKSVVGNGNEMAREMTDDVIAALYQLSHRSASVASLPALRASEFEQFKVVRISFPRRERLILCTSSS